MGGYYWVGGDSDCKVGELDEVHWFVGRKSNERYSCMLDSVHLCVALFSNSDCRFKSGASSRPTRIRNGSTNMLPPHLPLSKYRPTAYLEANPRSSGRGSTLRFVSALTPGKQMPFGHWRIELIHHLLTGAARELCVFAASDNNNSAAQLDFCDIDGEGLNWVWQGGSLKTFGGLCLDVTSKYFLRLFSPSFTLLNQCINRRKRCQRYTTSSVQMRRWE
jgi:hypothetical protein